MRTLRLALLATGIVLATAPGLAQDRGPDGREGHGPGGDRHGGDHGPRGDGGRSPQAPQAPQAPQQPPAPPRPDAPGGGRFGGERGDGGQPGWNRPGPRSPDGGDRHDRPRPDFGSRPDGDRPGFDRGRPGWRDDGDWRGGPGRGGPDGPRPDWRGAPDRFGGGGGRPDWRHDPGHDWRRYRENHGDLFHAPRYMPPRGYGYGYRRFDRGFRLQPYFYGRDYWLDDPAFYDLPPAYGPYRWVRYYDDVLLIDLRSGIVVDVLRDFFW